MAEGGLREPPQVFPHVDNRIHCEYSSCTTVRTWYMNMCTLQYSETSLIRHSMGPENNVGLGGCWIMECLLPYLCMVTVPHNYNGRIREIVGL